MSTLEFYAGEYGDGFYMSQFRFNWPDLVLENATSTSVDSNGVMINLSLRGDGFVYDSNQKLIDGTINAYIDSASRYGGLALTDINISVQQFLSVAKTDGTDDDAALLQTILSGNDVITGDSGDNLLFGGAGDDLIDGKQGNDIIISGPGADKLIGGKGHDTFVFNTVSDSTPNKAGQDTIADFTKSDRIDLSHIDANTTKAGDQAFKFIGTKSFSGHAGELRYQKMKADTFVYADIDGDKHADFVLHLSHKIDLQKGFFIL